MTPNLFIPTLKAKERQRLQNHLRRAREAHYADRLRAVLWSEQRQSVPDIAQLLGKHPSSIQRWLHDYLRFGLRGLTIRHSPGRPCAIDPDGEECLRQAVLVNPRDFGYRFTRWSAATLAEHLHREIHIPVSEDTVRRTLHRLRFSYKRPKLSLHHRRKRKEVRRAERERDAALKKRGSIPNVMFFCSRTSANSISIPA
jgi:transposase